MDAFFTNLMGQWDGWGTALYVLLTTLISGVLASIIGFERESKGQAAGLRTHVILAVGSSLMMTISIWAIAAINQRMPAGSTTINYDGSRIAASIISGIGFLCAGTIIRNGLSVRGLTTSATLWVCAGIGMAVGGGFVLEAIIATAMTFFFLLFLVRVEKAMDKRAPQVRIVVAKNVPFLKTIHQVADNNTLIIKNIVTEATDAPDGTEAVDIKIYFAYHSRLASINDFCEELSTVAGVHQVKSNRFERNR